MRDGAESLFQSYFKRIDNLKWFFFDNLHLNLKVYLHIWRTAKYNLHNVRKKVLKQIEGGREKEGGEVIVIMENTCSSMT